MIFSLPRPCTLALFWLLACSLGWAYEPAVNTVLPRGGQLGSAVSVTLYGDRLDEVEEIILYQVGITVTDLKVVNAKQVKGVFRIAADAPLGEHPFRVRTSTGVSYLRTFWVNPLPSIQEVHSFDPKRKRDLEKNDSFESPQVVELNKIIHGVARKEDADYYRFRGKKGQRITAEVFGMRLGRTMFDPYLAILDSNRFELATCDDTVLTKRDPFLSLVLPADGDYTILVRESSYQGDRNSDYLLHLLEGPRPTSVHPPVGQPGQKLKVTFRGDADGGSEQVITLPAKQGLHPIYAESKGRRAPSPNFILVSPHPIVSEREPNNLPRELQGQAMVLPVACHGVIEKPGDHDWFLFKGKKGQQIRVQVSARELRSPLDPLILLRTVKDNKTVSTADDDGNFPDGKIDLKVPEDGDYRLMIRDHLNRGGPGFTYVITIATRSPAISAELPYAENNNSQKHRAIVIPRGNHLAISPNVARQNTNCTVMLQHDQLPPGVRVTSGPASRAPTNFPILFSAGPEAPLGSTLTTFTIKDTESDLSGAFLENIHHVEINNAGSFWSTRNDRLTVAVTKEAPFHLEVGPPPVPLVRNGTMDLIVRAKRQEGFEGPIRVTLPWRPPGMGAPPEVTIEKGKSEATIPINANNGAPVGDYELLVTGGAKTEAGEVRVSSPFVPLTVAEPFLNGKIDLATTVQGQDIILVCSLEQLRPFQGKAELTLENLPHQVTAQKVEFSAQDTSVQIPLTIPPEVRPGKSKNIFARVVVKEAGEPIPHQIAQGTILIVTPREEESSSD